MSLKQIVESGVNSKSYSHSHNGPYGEILHFKNPFSHPLLYNKVMEKWIYSDVKIKDCTKLSTLPQIRMYVASYAEYRRAMIALEKLGYTYSEEYNCTYSKCIYTFNDQIMTTEEHQFNLLDSSDYPLQVLNDIEKQLNTHDIVGRIIVIDTGEKVDIINFNPETNTAIGTFPSHYDIEIPLNEIYSTTVLKWNAK